MQTVDFTKFNNNWYQPGSKIKILFWLLTNILFFNNSFPIPNFIKIKLLKIFGSKLGANILIKPSVSIKYPWFLEIGDNCWIGESVWIDNLGKVKIGSNVCLSQGAMLLTGNHNYKNTTFDLMIGAITLQDGCWVGAKSVVCPGVTMKSHSILTVGSVLTTDAEPYTIYQGNPAKPIKERIIQ